MTEDDTPDDVEPIAELASDVATPHSGTSYKVLGQTDASGGTGVLGHTTAGSGTNFGVYGRTDSTDTTAAAVRADADDARGVYATTQSEDAFFALTTSGRGIYTQSSNSDGAQFNTLDAGQTGVWGRSSNVNSPGGAGYGVEGRAQGSGTGAAGVYGEAENASGHNYGVDGVTRSSVTGAAGVRGRATQGSGQTYGVHGTTNSADGYGLATPDDATVGGTLETPKVSVDTVVDDGSGAVTVDGTAEVTSDLSVSGTRSVGSLGVDAGLENAQSVAGSLTTETVVFDNAYTNDQSAYDTSTGEFTAPWDGAYQFDAQVQWENTDLSSGERLFMTVNGEFRGTSGPGNAATTEPVATTGAGDLTTSVSKTLFRVDSGEKLTVTVSTDSNNGSTLKGDPNSTFLSIVHLG
jgi:hypothetical protein